MAKFSDLIQELVPDERTRAAIDRQATAYIGKMLRSKALDKEMLQEHIYQNTPKNDIAAEEEFLARIILYPTESFHILHRLGAVQRDLFYDDRFKIIFIVVCHLQENELPIHIEAIINELRGADELEAAGGEDFLRLLVVGVSLLGLEEYANSVVANYECRIIWEVAAQTLTDLQHIKPNEAVSYREGMISKLSLLSEMHVDTQTCNDGETIANEMIAQLQAAKKRKELGIVCQYPTHLVDMNKHTKGWNATDLIIIAARPAMGKTSYVLADMICALQNNEPCLFFSLEMDKTQLAWRMMAIYYEIPDLNERIKDGTTTAEDDALFESFLGLMRKWKIYIIDTIFDLDKIKVQARLYAKKYGIKRIYLDYIQLANAKGFNSEQIVSEISRSLKLLAKELGVPLIALSQLSRAVESRPNKRPLLSDLRSSGSIEQDADMIIFLYRAEYYGLLEDEDGTSLKGIGELIVSKYRHGALGTIKAFFNAPCVKWDNLDKLNQNNYSNKTTDWLEEQASLPQEVSIFNKPNSESELPPPSKLEFKEFPF